jgi:hypothetical protein
MELERVMISASFKFEGGASSGAVVNIGAEGVAVVAGVGVVTIGAAIFVGNAVVVCIGAVVGCADVVISDGESVAVGARLAD